MTIKEAILSYPGLSDIPDNYISKVLIDRSVDGAVDYTISQAGTVALCAADCYMAMLTAPDFTEGSLSMKYSKGFFKTMAASLYADNGEADKARRAKVGKGNANSNWW